MESRSTTSTVPQYPIKGVDRQAAGASEPRPTNLSAGSVSQRLIVTVPPHHAPGSPSVLAGLLPRTGVTIALLLALVALLLIAAGTAITRVARRAD